jgi:hypothetical protein
LFSLISLRYRLLAGGMIHTFSLISSCAWKVLWKSTPVFFLIVSINRTYRLLVPGSLNWLAMVPTTGSVSSSASHSWWLRLYCFFTSRTASRAPRLSNLLMATTSAKSSMSIFSSCVAAPNSGVMM